jgi:hypothetical protein
VNTEFPIVRRGPIALGLGLVAAAIAFGALASTADARPIKLAKAHNLSSRITQSLCAADPTCLGREVEPCRRISAQVARCRVHVFGEDKLGPYDCHWTDQWKVKKHPRRWTWSENSFKRTFHCNRDSGEHFVPEALAARVANRD